MKSFRTENFEVIDFTDMNASLSKEVWECRNLPEIRKWMTNDQPISFESHQNFIRQLCNLDNASYYSVLLNGAFIGSINFHFEEGYVAERGIYLNPDFIGKGLAKKLCHEIYAYFRDKRGIRHVKTKVKKENINSNALEASLGAVISSEDDDYNYYLLDL